MFWFLVIIDSYFKRFIIKMQPQDFEAANIKKYGKYHQD